MKDLFKRAIKKLEEGIDALKELSEAMPEAKYEITETDKKVLESFKKAYAAMRKENNTSNIGVMVKYVDVFTGEETEEVVRYANNIDDLIKKAEKGHIALKPTY